MSDIDHFMLLILSVDPDASVKLSTYTGRWYVVSKIERYDKGVCDGITHHEDTPQAAIEAFFTEMIETPIGQTLFIRRGGVERMYTWNGAAFTESWETLKVS